MFIAALFTIARTCKQPKFPSTVKWIKKVWYIYTIEYYSAIKKEQNCAICRGMDRPRDCHTERIKSEREKQVSENISCMWNLEKWYRGTYLQSRNRNTQSCREQIYGYQRGYGGQDELGHWNSQIYATMYKIDN